MQIILSMAALAGREFSVLLININITMKVYALSTLKCDFINIISCK